MRFRSVPTPTMDSTPSSNKILDWLRGLLARRTARLAAFGLVAIGVIGLIVSGTLMTGSLFSSDSAVQSSPALGTTAPSLETPPARAPAVPPVARPKATASTAKPAASEWKDLSALEQQTLAP